MVENSENLERATISEAYLILESFNLTNEETCRIAQQIANRKADSCDT